MMMELFLQWIKMSRYLIVDYPEDIRKIPSLLLRDILLKMNALNVHDRSSNWIQFTWEWMRNRIKMQHFNSAHFVSTYEKQGTKKRKLFFSGVRPFESFSLITNVKYTCDGNLRGFMATTDFQFENRKKKTKINSSFHIAFNPNALSKTNGIRN